MANLKACRFCLITDVRMEDITGTLEDNIASIFGRNLDYTPDLPAYVCYECSALVRKFNKFRKKYLLAQSILYDILQNRGKITEKEIKNIDRHTLKLKSNLSHVSLEVADCTKWSDLGGGTTTDDILMDRIIDGDSSDDDYIPLPYAGGNSKTKDAIQENASSHNNIESFEPTTQNISDAMKRVIRKAGSDDDLVNDFVITKLTRSGGIVCEVCKFRFNTRRAHAMHVLKHAKKYACNRCNFTTVHAYQAMKHKQCHETVSYQCDQCDETSSKLTFHLSHMRLKHSPQAQCPVCGYCSASRRRLERHNTRMHRLLPPPATDKRSEVPWSESKMEWSAFCAECELHFSSREAWRRHSSGKHQDQDTQGAACRRCGEVFPGAGWARAHHCGEREPARARALVRSHSAPAMLLQRYPVKCDHCEKMMLCRTQHWKHHSRHHQDERFSRFESNYVCEICQNGLPSNAFLVYHKSTHFPERAYKCGRCLKRHHRRPTIHPEHRAFACTICMKTFKTKQGLQQHFKNHTGIRPFQCQYCGKTFSRGVCLTQHIKHAHLKPLFAADN